MPKIPLVVLVLSQLNFFDMLAPFFRMNPVHIRPCFSSTILVYRETLYAFLVFALQGCHTAYVGSCYRRFERDSFTFCMAHISHTLLFMAIIINY